MKIMKMQVDTFQMRDMFLWLDENHIDCRALYDSKTYDDPYDRHNLRPYMIMNYFSVGQMPPAGVYHLDFEFTNNDDALRFKLTWM